ncbi:MAG: outer membrane lipoprotein carrier protein LolA [Fibrobacteria bacterium]|nr:outer membrane lipoprotein carrier protein LolA [Fibrobacteria bacterium]
MTLLLLLLSPFFHAGAASDSPWLPRVAQVIQNAPGWKVELAMTTRLAEGGLPQGTTTRGQLHLSKERFRFQSDLVQILCDGPNHWTYLPASGQSLLQKTSQLDISLRPSAVLQQALSGAERASKLDTLEGKSVRRLDLEPGTGVLARFNQATLWIDKTSLHPRRLVLADAKGLEIRWDLTAWSSWTPEEGAFLWKAPEGSETVDLRD